MTDLNFILTWIVLISTLAMLVRLLRFKKHLSASFGWLAVSIGILLCLAISFILVPDACGKLTAMVWLSFLILPAIVIQRMRQLLMQGKYKTGLLLAHIARWLHPFDGTRDQIQLVRAMKLAHEGALEEALSIFDKHRNDHHSVGRAATLNAYRYRSDWTGMREWLTSLPSLDALAKTFSLRACGELGDLDAMILTLSELEEDLLRLNATEDLMAARMMTFAFCGRVELTRELLEGPITHLPPSHKSFWMATAELASGDGSAGYEFEEMVKDPHVLVRQDAAYRLRHPPAYAAGLSPESERSLLALEQRCRGEGTEGKPFAQVQRGAYATFILIGLNLATFLLEDYVGDSTDADTLYSLGALLPSAVWNGQWWRLFTSLFLHAGWLHIAMNMMGLYYFGPFLEHSYGRMKFLCTYFISGLLASFTILILSLWFGEQMVVGASGCLMGILGATLGVHLHYWRHHQVRVARQRLLFLLTILGIQVVFDIVTPHISFSSHLFGALYGFGFGCLFKPKQL